MEIRVAKNTLAVIVLFFHNAIQSSVAIVVDMLFEHDAATL